MIKKLKKKLNFVVEVDNNIDCYDFFREYKTLKAKGFFKNVVSILKLDENKNEVEIKKENHLINTPEQEDVFGLIR